MTHEEIRQAITSLSTSMQCIEEEYIDNGGEITENTMRMEVHIEHLKNLLTSDGIDSLGRWLKSVQDEREALKNERDYINRRIKSKESTEGYIKALINEVMNALGIESIKGQNGYSFKATISTTTSVDRELLEDRWQAIAECAIREAGVPEYITLKLNANKSKVEDGAELPEEFITVSTPSVRFTKPRKSSEE